MSFEDIWLHLPSLSAEPTDRNHANLSQYEFHHWWQWSSSIFFETCQDYLKTHHDLPIEEIRYAGIVIYIRQHGTEQLSDQVKTNCQKNFWENWKQDTWYESDLKILSIPSFSAFHWSPSISSLKKSWKRLEVYKNYQHLYDFGEWQSYSLTFPPFTYTIKTKNMCQQPGYT